MKMIIKSLLIALYVSSSTSYAVCQDYSGDEAYGKSFQKCPENKKNWYLFQISNPVKFESQVAAPLTAIGQLDMLAAAKYIGLRFSFDPNKMLKSDLIFHMLDMKANIMTKESYIFSQEVDLSKLITTYHQNSSPFGPYMIHKQKLNTIVTWSGFTKKPIKDGNEVKSVMLEVSLYRQSDKQQGKYTNRTSFRTDFSDFKIIEKNGVLEFQMPRDLKATVLALIKEKQSWYNEKLEASMKYHLSIEGFESPYTIEVADLKEALKLSLCDRFLNILGQ